jgi:hypothetical protein
LLNRLGTVVALTDRRELRRPSEVHLQTRTLRYGRMHWVRATGLEEHWKDARIDGKWETTTGIELKTSNVNRIELLWPGAVSVTVDGQALERGEGQLLKEGTIWRWTTDEERAIAAIAPLAKRPGLQGPIDDAFLEPFVVIAPSDKSRNGAFQAWCDLELAHFRSRWRALMRAELPVVENLDLARRARNVILWGDPDSNEQIRGIMGALPLEFENGKWKFGGQTFDGNRFAPAIVFPRPAKQPKGYIVLNSGLTFREGHDRTNSLQNPKLPDWAIIDITQPPDALSAGRIHDAGFFDEAWKLKGPVKGP